MKRLEGRLTHFLLPLAVFPLAEASAVLRLRHPFSDFMLEVDAAKMTMHGTGRSPFLLFSLFGFPPSRRYGFFSLFSSVVI